ncbi:MAG: hypothetical protein NTU83_03185 [Candidatus Hydrogenedentes bacterium]|nr:hypothetical protein [Candidatus Hydrogenedentota bacterium]
MRKGILTLIVFLVAGLNAWGVESFQQRLDKANADLKNGKIDDALTAYRDLQTEDPESETLYYDFGCAHYRQGKEAGDQKQAQDALTSFEEAKKSFEKVLNARDPEIRKKASFEHANAVAQIALQSKEAQKYDETVKAFEEAVKEDESFLKQYPGDQGAHAKLDYMRYLLKSMLQNPPPPQQQQGQGDQKKDQKDDQKKDQKQEQKEQQGENKDQEKKDEQKDQKEAGKDENKEKKDEKSEKAQEASELKDQVKDQKDQKEKPQDEAKQDDKQNVDAILQSLEDTDHREQRDMKNQRSEVKMRKEWW